MKLPIGACALLLALSSPLPGSAAPVSAAAPPIAITAGSPANAAAWGADVAPTVRAAAPRRSAAFTATVVRQALRYLGRPYRWSGIGQGGGFDCSGLVFRVFAALGMPLPHSSSGQYAAGTAVTVALPGDLVFFHMYTSGPSHVGIYLGAGRFIHASVSRGVIVSSMNDPYYRSRYLGARRY